jgi:acetyl-CoA carboxylase biotin carboxyl carrier protein
VADDGKPVDVRTIKRLAALMSRHDLSEIEVTEGATHLRLRRGGRVKLESFAAPVPTAAPVPAAAAPPPAAEKPARQLHEIKSPTPGTFYAQEKPGTPPFVSVGSRVTPTTVVCVIEAMKIFNDITADCTGVVVEVLAGDKQAVEYGTVLFRVDPSA